MKAVIFGGCISGMRSARRLREMGYDVEMVLSSTYLGEDLVGTWRCFPKDLQAAGRDVLSSLELPLDPDTPLLPGLLKKAFLAAMDAAGVNVRFMTRLCGIAADGQRVTAVTLADKLGTYAVPCDLVVDATLYKETAHILAGVPLVVPAGETATLMLEYRGISSLPQTKATDPLHWMRGVIAEDHAYLRIREVMAHDTPMREVRDLLLSRAAETALAVGRDDTFSNAFLMDAVAPYPEVSLAAPRVPYENVFFADTLPSDLPQAAGDGRPVPLMRETMQTEILVVGGGTAGVRAALSAATGGAKVILAECFSTLGGTRTTGGTQSPYDGSRNGLFRAMWQELRNFAHATRGIREKRSSAASEALLYETLLARAGVTVLRPAIAYAVEKDGALLSGVSFAAEGGLWDVRADIVIDATGDADLVCFAGGETHFGSAELGCTQNYSQSHRRSDTRFDTPMADQDVMDNTDRCEWTRAIRQNTERCAPYDIFEMLTVRESRRIVGRRVIRLSDVYRGTRPTDAIYDCMADYDTHSRCFSLIGRFGVLPCHAPVRFVSVPYGALLPVGIDNLMVCGKALSAEQEVAAHLRMSPDVMGIGHLCGRIAAEVHKAGKLPPDAELRQIQKDMTACGALIRAPRETTWVEVTPQMLASRLSAGDVSAFADALLCDDPKIAEELRELRACGLMHDPLLVSMVLLYYGDDDSAETVAAALDTLDRSYGVKQRREQLGRKIVLGGDQGGQDPYWQINALVMLLAYRGRRETVDLLVRVMDNTCIGVDWRETTIGNYRMLRPDLPVHGNFDRMLTLAYAACAMPDPRFAAPIMRLLELQQTSDTRADVFATHWLEIKLAQAATLCGSDAGRQVLETFRESRYAILRRFADRALQNKDEKNQNVF